MLGTSIIYMCKFMLGILYSTFTHKPPISSFFWNVEYLSIFDKQYVSPRFKLQ